MLAGAYRLPHASMPHVPLAFSLSLLTRSDDGRCDLWFLLRQAGGKNEAREVKTPAGLPRLFKSALDWNLYSSLQNAANNRQARTCFCLTGHPFQDMLMPGSIPPHQSAGIAKHAQNMPLCDAREFCRIKAKVHDRCLHIKGFSSHGSCMPVPAFPPGLPMFQS